MWQVRYEEDSITLAITLAGDYNDDGVVNLADYSVWRDALGQTVSQRTRADGNGDGVISADDYGVWKSNFGQQIPAGVSQLNQTVPEPGPFRSAYCRWRGYCGVPFSGSLQALVDLNTYYADSYAFRTARSSPVACLRVVGGVVACCRIGRNGESPQQKEGILHSCPRGRRLARKSYRTECQMVLQLGLGVSCRRAR